MWRLALTLMLLLATLPAAASDVVASAPHTLSVTVYRAPYRAQGSIDLDNLGGFALVTETRTVHIPAGLNRIRFVGVADGIDAASAIVTGLPTGVIEKNRDAQLLSPAALIEAALGRPVALLRTDKATGKVTRVPGTILSGGDGVVFKTAAGIEALRCSGMAETFAFSLVTPGLSAKPTLSVLTRSGRAIDAEVTLSYLARGFDWSADYVATLAPGGRTIDLGAWVTLANGNGTGFLHASTNVVAGRLNRATGQIEPIDIGAPILAQCWPMGTTSDIPEEEPEYLMEDRVFAPPPMALPAPPPPADIVVTGARVQQEQLGDLKLYRVPEPTTVASRESKQVRLLDSTRIPVDRVYGADLPAGRAIGYAPASVLLRSENDKAHRLGLPLPSGRVAVFQTHDDRPLLLGEAGLGDTAVDETVEFALGPAPDVQVRQIVEERRVDQAAATVLPLVPGIILRTAPLSTVNRIEIGNAGRAAIVFELRLQLADGASVARADHPVAAKNGRPIFRLSIPAGKTVTVRYQTQQPG